jgi:hypothetical protein
MFSAIYYPKKQESNQKTINFQVKEQNEASRII